MLFMNHFKKIVYVLYIFENIKFDNFIAFFIERTRVILRYFYQYFILN